MTATWAALGLYLLGLAAAFGWRTLAQLRTTGDSGFRGLSGRPGSPAWWGGVLFAAALVLGVTAPILALLRVVPVPPALRSPAPVVAGFTLILAGLAGILVAQSAMGRSWRVGVDACERTELVTTGLFAHVRNPVFTGMVVVSTGMMLVVPTLVSALALLCLTVAVHLQVRAVEEPYLRSIHGAGYERYLASTGRFLPRPGRPRPPAS